MTARLIAVVGPSGVGKDTVMEAVASAVPDVSMVRRVITRPSEAGGEDFDGVSREEFDRRVASGSFCLWWDAHGLSYGIPRSEVEGKPDGSVALVNLSRAVLDNARETFEGFCVLSLIASPETLAARLGARGRESAEDIARRLERAGLIRPEGDDVIEVRNDGALEETVATILAALYPERV